MKNWRYILFGVGFMVLALCCGIWMLSESQQVYAGIENSPMESAIFGVIDKDDGAVEEAKIWTDKADYPAWGAPVISGSGFAGNAKVTITVVDPAGGIIEGVVTTGYDGTFQARFMSPSGLQAGTYTVSATDGTNTANTSFTDCGIALEVTKVAKVNGDVVTTVDVGDEVEYFIYVANRGPPDAPPIKFLYNFEGCWYEIGLVWDSMVGNLWPYYVSGDTEHWGQLDYNETWMFSYTHTVTACDPDPLVNLAFAVGMYKDTLLAGMETMSDLSAQIECLPIPEECLETLTEKLPEECMLQLARMRVAYDYDLLAIDINGEPSLDITKMADRPYAYAGDTITYTVAVTNNIPDSSIHDVVVVDSLAMGTLTDPVKSGGNDDDLLDYGETWTYTFTYTVEVDDPNVDSYGMLVNYAAVTGWYCEEKQCPDGDKEITITGGGPGCGCFPKFLHCMPHFLHCFDGCFEHCCCDGGCCHVVYDIAEANVEILADGEISQIEAIPPEFVFDYCGFVLTIDWFGEVRHYPCTADGALCANVLIQSPDGNSILGIPWGTVLLDPVTGKPLFENKDPDLVGMLAGTPPPGNGTKVLRVYRLTPDGVVFEKNNATIVDRFSPAEAAGGQLAWAYYDAKAGKWVEIAAPGTIAGGYTLLDAIANNVADVAAPYFAIIVK